MVPYPLMSSPVLTGDSGKGTLEGLIGLFGIVTTSVILTIEGVRLIGELLLIGEW